MLHSRLHLSRCSSVWALKAMWEGRNTPEYMGFQPRVLVLLHPGLHHPLSLSPLLGSKIAFQTESLEVEVHMPLFILFLFIRYTQKSIPIDNTDYSVRDVFQESSPIIGYY